MQNHGLEFDGTKDVEAQMLRDIKELKHIVRVTIIRNLDLLYLQVFWGDIFLCGYVHHLHAMDALCLPFLSMTPWQPNSVSHVLF